MATAMIRNISLANNEGTFGAAEARRATGSGDSGNSEIYIDAAGTIQWRGCHPRKAPGRFRWNPEHRFHLTRVQKAQLESLLGYAI